MSQVIIIGSGPAGVSTAIYLARAGIHVTVIGKDGGSLEKAEKIENYYGFSEPITGKELVETGIKQAERLGVVIVRAEAVGIGYDGSYSVKTTMRDYSADFLVLATGVTRGAPKIKGLAEFEGRGVSYCAVCDGFFYKGKPVAVLGSGDYAANEAEELIHVASGVTVLTDGKEVTAGMPASVGINKGKIKEVYGGDVLEGILFEDGTKLEIAGVFIAYGVAGSADLAKKLGAETEGNKIVVNATGETTIPGLYAVGDCTGGIYQVSKAVYDGVNTATHLIAKIRGKA